MRLNVNGKEREVDADASATLLEVLRDDLGLTGTKYGCGEGQCAACTVLLDGQPVRSCITPVTTVGAAAVSTIEGLEKNGALHPVQQAFLDDDAMQCGYCVAGMIMEAVAFLKENPKPTDAEIAEGLQPHICRCGVYPRYVAAVKRAATQMEGSK